MRPLLVPALQRLWRDQNTLQLGVNPETAVIISDIDGPTRHLLAHLDGRHTMENLVELADKYQLDQPALVELITELHTLGVLLDGEPVADLPSTLPAESRRLLANELSALTLRATAHHSAGNTLAHRLDSRVIVHSSDRLGPAVASLLAASGVGRVHIAPADDGNRQLTRPTDALPGGIRALDDGRPYLTAARDAILRANPRTNTRTIARRHAHIAVLADDSARNAARSVSYHIRGIAHLPITIRDGMAVIGPLVIPTVTACLNCLDLHRSGVDPSWPALAAQLASTVAHSPPTSATVAAAAAAICAAQVLGYLDNTQPATRNATLELSSTGDQLWRRPWQPHPECGCVASAVATPAVYSDRGQ